MMKAERINKGRKYQQVIAGAKAIFLSEGFEAANMDVIAQTAKVSKATLYSYFPDKQSLFIQVAKSECENQADNDLKIIDQTQSVDKVLYQAAAYTINCLISDIAQQIFRICVSEIERFPILGKSFYENGPMMGQAKLVEYFIYAEQQGYLKIKDLYLAADQFTELCKADLYSKALFGIQKKFTDAEIDRVAKGVVQIFLAKYGNS
jgi:AcrR family transcriptional regulator